ncbi:hypothetical protein [Natrinema sp. DC36]|uniref:hypothetical protein n=1 Tax=Natrinema sp. DC36 TaxID=2878680 RepID=UPI001CF066C5|nr:hypothetical protein [Natrinema sp. DC36]
MVLTYVLVAVLAIAGYEAVRGMYTDSETEAAAQFARAAIVIALFIVTIPLGMLLGMLTVSALAENLAIGLVVLAGSATVVAVIGLGLYIVAEGEMPAILKRYSIAR